MLLKAVDHYQLFQYIYLISQIKYHGQLCQMPLINLVEPDMTRFPFQP